MADLYDRIPKVELHCHLEGTVRPATVAELAATHGRPLSVERVEAFCSWLPYRAGQAAVVDLMRKRNDAVSGTMDLLLAESLQALKDEGLEQASLANAPLANVGEPRGPLDRGVALLFENLNAFYGYKNLFQFKKKFAQLTGS